MNYLGSGDNQQRRAMVTAGAILVIEGFGAFKVLKEFDHRTAVTLFLKSCDDFPAPDGAAFIGWLRDCGYIGDIENVRYWRVAIAGNFDPEEITGAGLIVSRFARQHLLESLPKGRVWAEVGVWKGSFSQRILTVCEPSELHLIDPWRFMPQYPVRQYGGAAADSQATMNHIYRWVIRRFSHSPAVTVHRQTSAEACENFPDGYFDYVYIDGDHSYEFVLQDLRLWAPKVRCGGALLGDDYRWNHESGRSVERAVQDFVAESGSSLSLVHTQFIIRAPAAPQ